MTLRNQIARATGRLATGRPTTGTGSDAQRDCCSRRFAPADEARPPIPHGRRAWRQWDPHGCTCGPESRSQPETAAATTSFNKTATIPETGMDPRNESMGSEVWTRYGIGSMNQARSGTGIDSILSIYARIASQERTGLQSWCPTATSALADNNFRVVDLVLWRRPSENPVLPSANSTTRS